jgi:hypothetical protein
VIKKMNLMIMKSLKMELLQTMKRMMLSITSIMDSMMLKLWRRTCREFLKSNQEQQLKTIATSIMSGKNEEEE